MTELEKGRGYKAPQVSSFKPESHSPTATIILIVIIALAVLINTLFIANPHTSQSSIMPSSSSLTSTPTNNMGATGPRCTVEGCVREAVTGTQLCVIRELMTLPDRYAPAY